MTTASLTDPGASAPAPPAPADPPPEPAGERPLGGYAVLTSVFLALTGTFGAWFRRSGRKLPDRMEARDLMLLSVAGHKLARTVTKARVTSTIRAPFTEYQGSEGRGEVRERARGTGLSRAIGELLTCPYCLGLWVSAALTAMLLIAPRLTRWTAAVLSIFFGTEILQLAYRGAEDALDRH